MSTNKNVIKITQSNANVINHIKVVPVNEFTKEHNQQYFIKYIKPTVNQHDILQFMEDSTSNYQFSEKSIFLQQISNKKNTKNNGEPEFGMGSSFKRQQKSYKAQADVPATYTISIGNGSKAQKQFKTVPQEMNPNSQYLILVRKNQTNFDAYPIENWYKINPFTKLDISSIEESEMELLRKGQILDSSTKSIAEKYKIKETEKHDNEFYIGDESQALSDSERQEKDELVKRKKNNVFQRIRHGQGDLQEGESDVDDHQGDEVDYMSDSSFNEDNLSDREKDKLYETVDVDQEQFLRTETEQISGESDLEEEKKDEKIEAENGKIVIEDDDDDDDDSVDDSEGDSDSDLSEDEVSRKKAKSDYNHNLVTASLKRAHPDNTTPSSSTADKRRKLANTTREEDDETLKEIRKHLTRKPMLGKELFKTLIKKNLLKNNPESKMLFLEYLKRIEAKTEYTTNGSIYSL